MPPRIGRAAGRTVALATAAMVTSITSAPPAAAHAVGGGDLPAPPWLLGYGGVALVAIVAVALRSAPPTRTGTGPRAQGPATGLLRWIGLATYGLVMFAAFRGPDSPAGNIAPSAALVVFWVGLPLACLLAGDVFARLNPFDPVVAVLDRVLGRDGDGDGAGGPAWTGAAFLALFTWFLAAYHRPGSPRAVGVLLVVYGVLAIAGGMRWGRRWLRTGEGFGALSAGLAHLRQPGRPAPPALGAIAVVWLGGTAFDALGTTTFWVDLLGTSRGWERTMLDSVGLVWVLAMVAGVALAATRLLGDRTGPLGATVPVPLAAGLLAVAAAWFVLHDLTLLLFEGQNFLALASDPLSRGWDLFGTVDRAVDVGIVDATWVQWTHVLALTGGHALAVLAAHRSAAATGLRARHVVMVTRASGALAATGVAAATLLVLE